MIYISQKNNFRVSNEHIQMNAMLIFKIAK